MRCINALVKKLQQNQRILGVEAAEVLIFIFKIDTLDVSQGLLYISLAESEVLPVCAILGY